MLIKFVVPKCVITIEVEYYTKVVLYCNINLKFEMNIKL